MENDVAGHYYGIFIAERMLVFVAGMPGNGPGIVYAID
jgi:hypothetical protein